MYLQLRYVTEKLLEPGQTERSIRAELEDQRPNPQRTLILLGDAEFYRCMSQTAPSTEPSVWVLNVTSSRQQ